MPSLRMDFKAVLLDLDGTLLDTAPDLAAAANAMLAELRRPLLPERRIRDFIGQGIPNLVRRCLEESETAGAGGDLDLALARFAAHYERLNGRAAAPFPGVLEGLERLRAAGARLACVTNKAARFARPLLERAGLARYMNAVITADEVGRRKPDPAIFLRACRALDAAPHDALVIGDSANDAQGARAAGCRVLLVPYGYREGRTLEEIDCDGVIGSLAELAPD